MRFTEKRSADLESFSDLLITRKKLTQVALGIVPATYLLQNCRLINVFSREIYTTNIAIYQDRIASISASIDLAAEKIINCSGLYAAPGLMDPHMHVDTTMLWPGELARLLVPCGTTTVFVDTTNLYTTGGLGAVRSLIDSFKDLPLKGYISAPSYSPLNPELETVAKNLTNEDLAEMLSWPECVGIGETVASEILRGNDEYLSRIDLTHQRGLKVSGHGGDLPPGNENALDAYVAACVQDDHCVTKPEYLLPRLRRGLSLFLVETRGRTYLSDGLLAHIVEKKIPLDQLHLCIDNISVTQIVDNGPGYIDRLVSMAIDAGIHPADAYRMGSFNTAKHFGKADWIGSLSPGKSADILLLEAPDVFPPKSVFVGGEEVATNGELIIDIPAPNFPESYRNSIELHSPINEHQLNLTVDKNKECVLVQVIQIEEDDPSFNKAVQAVLKIKEGVVQPDIENDVLKMCVVERYGCNGNIALGFAQGFGLKTGAIATTISIPSNNIVAVGTNNQDIIEAINQLQAIQGGYVVVADGEKLAEVNLRLGGVMAEYPYETVVQQLTNAERIIQEVLGSNLSHPLDPLSYTGLCTLSDLGMTDRGLFDVATMAFVPVIIDQPVGEGSQA